MSIDHSRFQASSRSRTLLARCLGVASVFMVLVVVAPTAFATTLQDAVTPEADAFGWQRILRAVAVAVAIAAFLFSPFGSKAVRNFFRETDHALNLGICRIFVFGTILFLLDPARIVWLSRLPAELTWPINPPGGFLSDLPRSPQAVSILCQVMVAACITGMLGLFSRTSALVVAATGLYVFVELQTHGKTRWVHHLVWMAIVMAASPCGHALSLDALRRRSRGVRPAGPSRAYAWPIRFCWLFMGVAYFWPGFWKFVYSGFAWMSAENLTNKMLLRWLAKDFLPALRVDQMPALTMAAGIGTIAFEMLFIFALLARRWRWLLALIGVGFQLSTRYFMQIDFMQLLLLYPILIDWSRFGSPAQVQLPGGSQGRSLRSMAWVGVILFALGSLHGALDIKSWPFAVYPTFMGLKDPDAKRISVRAEFGPGDTRAIDALGILKQRLRHSQANALIRHATISKLPGGREAQLRALWDVLVAERPEFRTVERVTFLSQTVRLQPPDWPSVPGTSKVLLGFNPAR